MRVAVARDLIERFNERSLRTRIVRQARPLRIEPLAQQQRFLQGLGGLDQTEGVARGQAEAVRSQTEGAQERLHGLTSSVAHNERTLRNATAHEPNLRTMGKPVANHTRQPARLELIPC